jgi:RNA polymerase sigma-70 factor (ECF subfamily)
VEWRFLRGFIHRITKDYDSMDDIAQETWINWNRAQSYPWAILFPKTYFLRIARNTALEWTMKRKSEQGLLEKLAILEAARSEVESVDLIEQLSLPQELRELLAGLPPRAREAWTLCKIDELSISAAARKMRITDAAVKAHLARAVAHFTHLMEIHEAELDKLTSFPLKRSRGTLP